MIQDSVIHVRVSAESKARLERFAAEAGESLSAYVRRRLMAGVVAEADALGAEPVEAPESAPTDPEALAKQIFGREGCTMSAARRKAHQQLAEQRPQGGP